MVKGLWSLLIDSSVSVRSRKPDQIFKFSRQFSPPPQCQKFGCKCEKQWQGTSCVQVSQHTQLINRYIYAENFFIPKYINSPDRARSLKVVMAEITTSVSTDHSFCPFECLKCRSVLVSASWRLQCDIGVEF